MDVLHIQICFVTCLNLNGFFERLISDVASAKNSDGAYTDFFTWNSSCNEECELARHVTKNFKSVSGGSVAACITIMVVIIVRFEMGTAGAFRIFTPNLTVTDINLPCMCVIFGQIAINILILANIMVEIVLNKEETILNFLDSVV